MSELPLRALPTDLQAAITESHEALTELAAGNVAGSREIYARVDHATLFGAYGGHDIGWQNLAQRLEVIAPLVADAASGGELTITTLAAHADGNLAYTVELEHQQSASGEGTRDGGGSDTAQTRRVTQVFQRIDGTWKLVHRHADPLGEVGSDLADAGWIAD